MEKKIFFIIIGVTVLIILALMIINYRPSPEELKVSVITDKNEYNTEDVLKVKIENDSGKEICFSTCYPYYLEKKKGNWETYQYSACATANLVDNCVDAKGVRAYELVLSSIEKGPHRLVIPICTDCSAEESFEEDQRFYSSEFTIK